MRLLKIALLVLLLIIGVGAAAFFLGDFKIPTGPPALAKTFTPQTQPAPLEIGSFDRMGHVISRAEAADLLQTAEGQAMLSREQGALEITDELIALGRDAFYRETFGNELFLTDVMGILDGPVNLWTVSRAILALRGGHTTNLQIPVDEEVTVGGRTFPAGSLLNTGLDVAPGSLLPIGMVARVNRGRIQVGMACALCHVTVDPESGQLIEGATNIDLDAGLLMAMATNSTALFRNTDANPVDLPAGSRRYLNAQGTEAVLPDPVAMENAVDAAMLSWPPGTFDTMMDLVNAPTFIPSAYTFGQWPYGWNGFASLGWFQGLSTLANNVHGVNADPSGDAAMIDQLMQDKGIDGEMYLGVLLQNAARARYRLPEGSQPSRFFAEVNPTPASSGFIDTVPIAEYPNVSYFTTNGLIASRFGFPIGEHINAMSAFQQTLAPPPTPTTDRAALERGAAVFVRAGCADCHSGRYFSNNELIPAGEIGTQPLRARAMAGLTDLLVEPRVYPPSLTAPVAADAPTLPIPTDTTPDRIRELAYARNGEGGYKAISLIGIYLHAPYLHDGGVAAGPDALREEDGRFVVADATQLGMAGTLQRQIHPDPAASLRVLVDRQLRAPMIEANRADPALQAAHVEGIGHEIWVDEAAGFTTQEQSDLIRFLLSLDDDPEVLPAENRAAAQTNR